MDEDKRVVDARDILRREAAKWRSKKEDACDAEPWRRGLLLGLMTAVCVTAAYHYLIQGGAGPILSDIFDILPVAVLFGMGVGVFSGKSKKCIVASIACSLTEGALKQSGMHTQGNEGSGTVTGTAAAPIELKRSRHAPFIIFILIILFGGGGLIFKLGMDAIRRAETGHDVTAPGDMSTAVCDEGIGMEWCGRLERCVDPWIVPCEEDIDAEIMQRLNAVRGSSGRQVAYPERSVLEWRIDENNEIVQQKMDGLSVSWREVDYGTIERLTAALEGQGFEQDIQNMADGPGAGSWGYQLGGMVCVMRFQATNLKLPPDDTADTLQEPLRFDIDLTCGRLP